MYYQKNETAPVSQLVGHNLLGVVDVLEYCKNHQAGLLFLRDPRWLEKSSA